MSWVFDDYENRYCLMASHPKYPETQLCILTVAKGYFEHRRKFFEVLGPIAVIIYGLVYPPGSE